MGDNKFYMINFMVFYLVLVCCGNGCDDIG